jgi:hypothetical protein
MALTRPSFVVNTIQSLANKVKGQATALKGSFDKAASDIKTYVDTMCDEIEAQFTSKTEITTNRKLSATGDFTGTLNGYEIVEAEPGLSSIVTAHLADYASLIINVKYPPLLIYIEHGQAKGNANYYSGGQWYADSGHTILANDDTDVIQACIDYIVATGGSKVFIPSGNYLITSALSISDFVKIAGDGAHTVIKTATGDINGFELALNATKIILSDFDIVSPLGIGTSNAAIKSNATQGGAEQYYLNIGISDFKYGFNMGNEWWNNILQNVKMNFCDISFNHTGTDGNGINNLFIKCYSNLHKSMGWNLGTMKNCKWLVCNNGGDPATENYHMIFNGNCAGMSIDSCNFEGGNFGQDLAGIIVYGASTAKLDNCTFISSELAGAATRAFEVMAREESIVTVEDCIALTQGSGISDFITMNTAELKLRNNKYMDAILNNSTVKPLNMDKYYKASGTASVAGGGQLNTGLGYDTNQIFINIEFAADSYSAVMPMVTEKYGNGIYKIRYLLLTDGTSTGGTYTINWVAI